MKIKNINVHFTEAEIDKKIRELGARISEDYAGESVCLICILKGASFFTCELAKRITVPVEVEFMSVSSYGSGTESNTDHAGIDAGKDRNRNQCVSKGRTFVNLLLHGGDFLGGFLIGN